MGILDITPENYSLRVRDIASQIIPHIMVGDISIDYMGGGGRYITNDIGDQFVEHFKPILIKAIEQLPIPLNSDWVADLINSICGMPVKVYIYDELDAIDIKCVMPTYMTEHTYRFCGYHKGYELDVYMSGIRICK